LLADSATILATPACRSMTRDSTDFSNYPTTSAVWYAAYERGLRGIVQQVLRPFVSSDPEKVQISIEDGDELYREIRIEKCLDE
jgi:hypothetical protein